MNRIRQQRAWFFSDWASSAFSSTILGALFAPYLITIAQRDACGFVSSGGHGCHGSVELLGLPIAPGSLPSYVTTAALIIGAVLTPVVGATADRMEHKTDLLISIVWIGATATGLLFLMTGTHWLFGSVAFVIATVCYCNSLVVSDSLLSVVATKQERDRVSSIGWAFSYVGGGLLLAADFATVSFHDALGLSTEMSVRICLLSAGIWWAVFAVIPWRGITVHGRPPPADEGATTGSFGQLRATVKTLRDYPASVTFLAAYLFFNIGIQTMVASAATFGEKGLNLSTGVVLGAILLVQFVATLGAVGFARLANRLGTKEAIVVGLVCWMVTLAAGVVVPAENVPAFLVLGVALGLVLGGTQALARSYFSQLIPHGREAEYFGFYHALGRSTSWVGVLTVGLVYQFSGSYRPALLVLIAFFGAGALLLSRIDTSRAVLEASHEEQVSAPSVG